MLTKTIHAFRKFLSLDYVNSVDIAVPGNRECAVESRWFLGGKVNDSARKLFEKFPLNDEMILKELLNTVICCSAYSTSRAAFRSCYVRTR